MEVTFTKAKFSSRIFAFMVDAFLMIVTALGLVIGSRYLFGSMDFYQNATNKITEIQMASHLYYKDEKGDTTILCDHYDPQSEEQCAEYNPKLHQALSDFYHDSFFFDQDDSESGYALYIKQRMDSGLFIYTDDSHSDVAPKDDVLASEIYKTYTSLMKHDAVSYIAQNEDYINSARTLNLTFIFLILVLPITISVFIYEFIVPMLFKRGRKTIGKFLFKLGVVDQKGLSPRFGRFFARFILFYFVEIMLSLVAFLIPFIVSTSMFFFSKNNQSFHDYVSGTYVVNCENATIFMNKEEYIQTKGEAEQFELKSDMVDLK